MATINYRWGETAPLGFPVNDPTGQPMSLDGLALRLRILVPGTDIIIAGYPATGEFLDEAGGTPYSHPSVIAFDCSPANMPSGRRVYRALVEVDDGDGFRPLPGGAFFLNVIGD